MLKRYTFIMTALCLALSACVPAPAGPQLKAQDAWARPVTAAGDNGAIYLRLVNSGGEADRLLGAASPVAAAAELHETMQTEDGVMRMEPAPPLEIPARGQAELRPGGLHLMLIELQQPLAVGDRVPLTLQFEKSGEMTLDVEVQEQ